MPEPSEPLSSRLESLAQGVAWTPPINKKPVYLDEKAMKLFNALPQLVAVAMAAAELSGYLDLSKPLDDSLVRLSESLHA